VLRTLTLEAQPGKKIVGTKAKKRRFLYRIFAPELMKATYLRRFGDVYANRLDLAVY
jgi:hypothetical protein